MSAFDSEAARHRRTVLLAAAVAFLLAVAATLIAMSARHRAPQAPALAAANPRPTAPLPPPQQTQGGASAELVLAPQPAALTARVSGIADAKLQEGGSIEIRVFANGTECNGKRYYRESFMAAPYALSMACEVAVPAGQPMTFRATLAVDKGTVGPLELRARYEH